MKIKSLIIFDIDGTLTDSVVIHQKAFTESLAEIGVEKISSDLNSFKHHTDSFIAKEIYQTMLNMPFSKEKKRQFEMALTQKVRQEEFNEIAGAKKLIEMIQNETDFGICFATGSLRKPAQHKLKSIGIEYKDWQLVASDDIYERERIVAKAIEYSSLNYNVKKFERIISVGDGLWDLITAQNLELEFIGVGTLNKVKLVENGAKLICKNLTEFENKIPLVE
jgi:phosphoglycolate phosphatase-like HAD superfamily hydrolase